MFSPPVLIILDVLGQDEPELHCETGDQGHKGPSRLPGQKENHAKIGYYGKPG